MITVEHKPRRRFWSRITNPPVLAVFSYRYDHHLVRDMLANIEPYVDGWVSFDDRGASALFSNEPARRGQLLAAARNHGAKWILAMDPDERLERISVATFRRLASMKRNVAWNFNLREMYSTDSYRVDGIWGKKKQPRLFPLLDKTSHEPADLHGAWFNPAHYSIRNSDINIYHLKMIEPSRRVARRDLYKHLDPHSCFQRVGYDYLTDEKGATFETIPDGRGFHPPHQDDGGLWMGELSPCSQQRVEQPEQVFEEAAVGRTFVPKIGI